MADKDRGAVSMSVGDPGDVAWDGGGVSTLSGWMIRVVREGLILGVGYALYAFGRYLAGGHEGQATINAQHVWSFERTAGLPNEAGLQGAALHLPWLIELANRYYAWVHFPLTIAVLAWLFFTRPALYGWTRRVLLWLTVAALAVIMVFPLAPPRLMGFGGMTDTGVRMGMSPYGPANSGIANQFAAMPSLHFGWSVVVAIAVIAALRSRWRFLVLLHPVATLAVIIVTANHYWVDCIMALALLAGALWLARSVPAWRMPERDPRTVVRAAERASRPARR
jgi:hypothetical protein